MSRIPPEYLDPETSDRWVAADVLVREEPDEEEDEEGDGEEKEGEEEETRATQKETTTNRRGQRDFRMVLQLRLYVRYTFRGIDH